MRIIAHLGSTDEEYLLTIATFRPAQCPACGGGRVHHHDEFWRQGQQQQGPIQRLRCARARYRQVFSVLPNREGSRRRWAPPAGRLRFQAGGMLCGKWKTFSGS